MNKLKPGHGYANSEITKEDKFINPYTGKIYLYQNDQYATEITSMWFTESLRDLEAFIEKDPDHFEFIFKIFNE